MPATMGPNAAGIFRVIYVSDVLVAFNKEFVDVRMKCFLTWRAVPKKSITMPLGINDIDLQTMFFHPAHERIDVCC